MNRLPSQAAFITKRLFIAIGGLLLTAMVIPVQAEEAFPELSPEVKTHEWALSPAKEPHFALQFKLLPPLNERKPGNSAAYYNRATLFQASLPKDPPELHDRYIEWFDLPCEKLPLNEAKAWLARRRVVLAELQMATQCETCDWGTRFQDLRGMDVISVTLQEFQEARQLARTLRLQAKVEIAEKRYDVAFKTIQQSYRLAQDLATVPMIIVNLVAIASQSLANDSLSDLIAAEGSPNLYWALRGLPDPLVDVSVSTQFESSMAFRMFPFLVDADTAEHSPPEWHRLLVSVNFNQLGSNESLANRTRITTLVMRSYPIAKRELIAAGYNRERIERMPVGQVVAIFARDCQRYAADQLVKWIFMPSSARTKAIEATQATLIREGYLGTSDDAVADRDPLQINTRVGYNLTGISESSDRPRRVVTALATIEAIRMHAAHNNGHLPASLADISIVPVPSDPLTGKPLHYRVIDNRAELVITPTRPHYHFTGRRFLLRMR